MNGQINQHVVRPLTCLAHLFPTHTAWTNIILMQNYATKFDLGSVAYLESDLVEQGSVYRQAVMG